MRVLQREVSCGRPACTGGTPALAGLLRRCGISAFDGGAHQHAFKVYRTVSQGLSLFQQREVDAGLFYGHRTQQMMDAGLPMAKVVPQEGSYGVHTGTQVPRGAANPEAALAWVDATLGIPYQAAFAQSLYSPLNCGCVLPPDLAARPMAPAWTPSRRHPGRPCCRNAMPCWTGGTVNSGCRPRRLPRSCAFQVRSGTPLRLCVWPGRPARRPGHAFSGLGVRPAAYRLPTPGRKARLTR